MSDQWLVGCGDLVPTLWSKVVCFASNEITTCAFILEKCIKIEEYTMHGNIDLSLAWESSWLGMLGDSKIFFTTKALEI